MCLKPGKFKIRLTALGVILNFMSSQTTFALQPPSGLNNTQTSVNCDDFCSQFVSSAGAKTAAGLLSSSPWSISDDTLCAELGQPTSNAYNANPAPAASRGVTCTGVNITQNVANAIAAGGSGGSGIQATQDPSQSCVEAGKLRDHCLYHNSQVESHCMTYKLITSGAGGGIQLDGILLGVDFGVAATCGIACATENPVAIGLCSVAATAEGIAELSVTLTQMQSPLAQAVNNFQQASQAMSIGSAAGGGLGAMGGIAVGANGIINATSEKTAQTTTQASRQGSQTTARTSRTGRTAAKDAAKDAAQDESKKAQDKISKEKVLACGTAAIFAALGGIRTAALVIMSNSAGDACNSVNQLFSNNTGPSGSGTGGSGSGQYGNSAASAGGIGGGEGARGTGGNLAGLSTDQLNKVSDCLRTNPAATNQQCANQAGIGQSQTTASTDGNLFAPNGNAGSLLSPIPNLGDFVKKATTEGAGSALGSILPSSISADMGSALATVANTGQNEAPSFASALHLESAYASGGGGGAGAGKTGGSADNSFASLFGNSAGGGGAITGSNGSLMTYGDGPRVEDIWHTGTKMTIFQIISSRTWRVSNRLEKIEPRTFDPRE